MLDFIKSWIRPKPKYNPEDIVLIHYHPPQEMIETENKLLNNYLRNQREKLIQLGYSPGAKLDALLAEYEFRYLKDRDSFLRKYPSY